MRIMKNKRRKRKKSILLILISALTIGVAAFFAIQVVQSDSPTKYLATAKEALDKEEYEKSLELFKKVLEEDASHTEARTGLASAYMGLKQYDKAVGTLDEGIEIKPKEPQFYYFLSLAHEGLNDLPQVIQTLEDGIEATNNEALTELIDQLDSNITIAPERHYIQKGHSRNIVMEWEKSDGSILPVEAEWDLENEDYGSIEDVSKTVMTFHAEELGTVAISAKVGPFTKKDELHIEEQVVDKMTFTPEEIDPLSINQELELTVTGVDADGKEMELNPEWSSSDEEIIELSAKDGIAVTAKAMDEGVTSLTVTYQDLEKELDFIVEGKNKFVKTEVQGEGTISVFPNETSYPVGTDITLEAKPKAGYEFVRWEGDVTGTQNPLNMTLESSISVVAVFEPVDQATLNLSISGEGNIIRDTLDSHFKQGTSIALYAQPKSGWVFSHWEGSENGNMARIQVLMDGDKDIRAVFEKNGDTSPTISPSSSYSGSTNNGGSNQSTGTNEYRNSSSSSSNSSSNTYRKPSGNEPNTNSSSKPSNKGDSKPVENDKPKEETKPVEKPKPEEKPEQKPDDNKPDKEEANPSTGNDKDEIDKGETENPEDTEAGDNVNDSSGD
ncbi:tetratricopeptide repeat protein [Oceanobacillus sp. Castelsardo]|uniref:InlB B-repeat-containing protein n=1 Tax=Oceanobacillus sp. Castelsardo TaxID=1851204 RepID=UPI0008385B5C|nr:tetratricopeptide repeat protein [Oceanobacillus sp. Castelsardo]